MNVVLTRAKSLLIVICNPVTMQKDTMWRAFIKYCWDNNAYCGEKFAVLQTGNTKKDVVIVEEVVYEEEDDEDNHSTDDSILDQMCSTLDQLQVEDVWKQVDTKKTSESDKIDQLAKIQQIEELWKQSDCEQPQKVQDAALANIWQQSPCEKNDELKKTQQMNKCSSYQIDEDDDDDLGDFADFDYKELNQSLESPDVLDPEALPLINADQDNSLARKHCCEEDEDDEDVQWVDYDIYAQFATS